MSVVSTRVGAPLPYRLECRGQPPIQHAIIECCEKDCTNTDSFIFLQRQNPTFIAQKFERRGWEVNRQTARCPGCAHRNTRRKAAFARRDEEMQGKISLVKTEQATTRSEEKRQVYLVVVEAGVPTIRSIEGAQEMLFGEKTYLVIPNEQSDDHT